MTRPVVLLLAVILTVLTGLLLAGHRPWSGDALVVITASHGLNTGDLPVVALWVVGLGCCAWLWTRSAGGSQ